LCISQGFDVKVIDVNRTCKVTKVNALVSNIHQYWLYILPEILILHFSSQGGQIAKYTALLATGNYHGVVGFAKAKGPTAKIAIQRV
jgi:small subunit ribosomal protein S5